MSDSSCSNCDKECCYRDYSYNCYITECRTLQTLVTSEQKEYLKQVLTISEYLEEQGCEDSYPIKTNIKEVLEKLAVNLEATCSGS